MAIYNSTHRGNDTCRQHIGLKHANNIMINLSMIFKYINYLVSANTHMSVLIDADIAIKDEQDLGGCDKYEVPAAYQ